MTQTAKVYGDALYDLAREAGNEQTILTQFDQICTIFDQNPDYLRLLTAASLAKTERTALLDQALRGRVEQYLLNFLKLLCESGNIREAKGCCEEFRQRYHADYGILRAVAVTAVPMPEPQRLRLLERLRSLTGKQIDLQLRVDPAVLGGVRLELDGKQLDGTVRSRLDGLKKSLHDVVL